MTRRSFVLLALLAGCSKPASTPPAVASIPYEPLPDGPGTRVLFIGNSHTFTHNLPGMVEAMAKAGGKHVLQRSWAQGGTSLRDHLDRDAAKLLTRDKWDYVVLQQGASSLPESRADLKASAIEWARLVRAKGAKPVLYMVWPRNAQADGFALVSKSYREAGEAADCAVFAAGEAWNAALKDDPQLPLYSIDGNHADPAGTYLAALVVTHGLVGVRPDAVPSTLDLGDVGPVEIPEGVAAKLRRAATAVIDRAAK